MNCYQYQLEVNNMCSAVETVNAVKLSKTTTPLLEHNCRMLVVKQH